MSIEAWSVGDDFVHVVDTLEPIRLACPDGAFDATTIDAWRFSQTRSPLSAVGGLASVVETTWQFYAPSDTEPRVGGRLTDADGVCGTIISTQRMSDSSRWRCVTRRFELRPDAVERITVHRAVWQTTQEGPAITGWEPEPRSLRGVVWRDGYTAATSTEPPQPRALVVLSIGSAAVGDRIATQRTGLIEVAEIVQSESIGQPAVMVGRVVPEL